MGKPGDLRSVSAAAMAVADEQYRGDVGSGSAGVEGGGGAIAVLLPGHPTGGAPSGQGNQVGDVLPL